MAKKSRRSKKPKRSRRIPPRVRQWTRPLMATLILGAPIWILVAATASYLAQREAVQVTMRANQWESVSILACEGLRGDVASDSVPMSECLAAGTGQIGFVAYRFEEESQLDVGVADAQLLTVYPYSTAPTGGCAQRREDRVDMGGGESIRVEEAFPAGCPRQPLSEPVLEVPCDREPLSIRGLDSTLEVVIWEPAHVEYYYNPPCPQELALVGTLQVTGPEESPDGLATVCTSRFSVPRGYGYDFAVPWRFLGLKDPSHMPSTERTYIGIFPRGLRHCGGDSELGLLTTPDMGKVTMSVFGGRELVLGSRTYPIDDACDIVLSFPPEASGPGGLSRGLSVTGNYSALQLLGRGCSRHDIVASSVGIYRAAGDLWLGPDRVTLTGALQPHIAAPPGGLLTVSIEQCAEESSRLVEVQGNSNDVRLADHQLIPNRFQQYPAPVQAALVTFALGLVLAPFSMLRHDVIGYLRPRE